MALALTMEAQTNPSSVDKPTIEGDGVEVPFALPKIRYRLGAKMRQKGIHDRRRKLNQKHRLRRILSDEDREHRGRRLRDEKSFLTTPSLKEANRKRSMPPFDDDAPILAQSLYEEPSREQRAWLNRHPPKRKYRLLSKRYQANRIA